VISRIAQPARRAGAPPARRVLGWNAGQIRRLCAGVGASLSVCCGSPGAFAKPVIGEGVPGPRASATVAAPEAHPLRVWYRGSEGCPDGSTFLASLGRLGRTAQLAGAGDRVDFVVNVAHAEPQSSGRLERQSSTGTVAIRDVSAESCAEVAEVLALSLDLALQPNAEALVARESPSETAAPPVLAAGWDRRLGVQGSVEEGLARTFLPGAALFIALAPEQRGWGLRLSLRGAYGERDTATQLHVGLAASRVEACWTWMQGAFTWGPCGAVDLGLVFADGSSQAGRSDFGGWSSATVHLRVGWQLSRATAIEAQFGALFPFVHYRFRAETGGEVADSAALGMAAALGFSYRI
jgi:hypothetical protein